MPIIETDTKLHLDEAYLSELGEMPSTLCFVMGCHRSGTTLLYNLIAGTGEADYLSFYDIYFYPQLMHHRKHEQTGEAKGYLQDRLEKIGTTRQMDNMPIGVEMAEEFGFLLPDDDFLKPRLTQANRERFEEVCRKKRWLAGMDRTLVLKNPNEFYGPFLDIHRAYPSAKFIFLHRHPLKILSSQINAWIKMLDRRNDYFALIDSYYRRILDDPREKVRSQMLFRSRKGCEWILDIFVNSFHYYLDNIQSLPRDSYISLRYEDVCTSPREELKKLYGFLSIAEHHSENVEMVNPRNAEILEKVMECYEGRMKDLQPYLDELGYPPLL